MVSFVWILCSITRELGTVVIISVVLDTPISQSVSHSISFVCTYFCSCCNGSAMTKLRDVSVNLITMWQ